jgi:hypothetical protein
VTICTPWRAGNALNKLLAQIDGQAPARSKASDGSIGDSAHEAEGACGSQHNSCCIRLSGIWIIRARDFTHDPAHGADMGRISEQLRLSRDPRIRYIIFNRRITGPNYGWEWHPYSGTSPHTEHMHVSVWDDAARFDNTAPWRIAAPVVVPAQEVEMYAETFFSCVGVTNSPKFFGTPGGVCSWIKTPAAEATLNGLEDGAWIDQISPAHSDGAAPGIDRSLIHILGDVPPGFEDCAAFKAPAVTVDAVAIGHQVAVELAKDPANSLTKADVPAVADAVAARLGAALSAVKA